jgi:hypothetical protein
VNRSTKEEPSSIPAASPRLPRSSFTVASRADTHKPARKFPAPPWARQVRTAPGPYPPDFEPVYLSRDVLTLVPCVLHSVTLAEPTPSGSAGASRLCRGCSHPSRHLPGQAAPSFTVPAATGPAAKVSHLRSNHVRSTRGALPVLLPVGFPVSPPEPGVRLTAHRALHKPRGIYASELMPCSARASGSGLPGSSSA